MRGLTLVLYAVLAFGRPAQADGSGALAGTVRTADGTPLPHLVLTLTGPSGPRTIVTGPEGRYRAAGLAAGEYVLSPLAPGFLLGPEARATVGESEARLDLVLSPAPVREHVVVAATRGEAPLSTVGVSASALDRERIAEREPSSFLQLLQDLPGLAVARSGGLGLQASAFVRGGESRFARILVDGVPVNQPGGFFDLGIASPIELDRVEVVRGAASSLYGTDALAGVIHLVTRRAEPLESPSFRAEAEGGSFAWRRFLGGTTGRAGRFDWNAGLMRLDTDNQEPNSAFGETAGAASLGARLGERSTLRLVFRAEDGTVGTPGQTAFGRPDLDASFERTDAAVGAQLRHTRDRVSHELRVGFSLTEQLSLNPKDSGPFVPRYQDRVAPFEFFDFTNPQGFQNDTERLSFGYQAEVQAGRNLLSIGAELERESGELGDRAGDLISPERTNVGAYVQDRVLVGERLHLTLGGRVERNGSFGTRAVPRAAVAFRLRGGEDATTLKLSGGAGIKEPSFLESFGVSSFAKGNPDLEPERSRTFDIGIEQRLFGSRLRAEAVVFHHDYRDQIAFHIVDPATFQGTYVNLGRTRGRGLEVSLEAAPTAHLRLSAEYTLLDGKILVSSSGFDPAFAVGEPLIRRPRHQASLSARGEGGRLSGGATLVLVGRRADNDFAGLRLTRNGSYARLDARVRVKLVRGLEAFVVSENVLDSEYQEVLGYPALGRAVRAGLRFRSGSAKRP